MSELNAKKKEDKPESNHERREEDVDLSGIFNIAANLLQNTHTGNLNNPSKLLSDHSINSFNGLLKELEAVEHTNNEADNVNKILSVISTVFNETNLTENFSAAENQENKELKKLESKMDQILGELAEIKEQLYKVKVQNKKISKKLK